MDLALLRYRVSTGLIGFVTRLTEAEWDAAPPTAMDTLHQEFCQLEQSLIEIATRPSRVIRPPQPITEQQKIIDLAG